MNINLKNTYINLYREIETVELSKVKFIKYSLTVSHAFISLKFKLVILS